MEPSPPPQGRLWDGYSQRDSLSRAAQASPAPLRSRLHPKGVVGAPGAHLAPQGPSRLGPEASSPVAAPGSAAQASASVRTSAKPSRILLHSRVHLGLGVPCTPRRSPGYAYPPLGPGGRPCPGKIDLDTNRGSRQGIVKCPRPQLPPTEEAATWPPAANLDTGRPGVFLRDRDSPLEV
jgi:hypothetical protein